MTNMEWLAHTGYATMIRDSAWAYPILEILHLVGVTLLVGSITLTDLRLLGLSRKLPVTMTAEYLLRWTWLGFSICVLSGASLFVSAAPDLIVNPVFRFKLLLLAAAGTNAAFFHFRVYSKVVHWNTELRSPMAARCCATLSIMLWVSIVIAGRWIAYVTT